MNAYAITISDLNASNNKNTDKTKTKSKDIFSELISDVKDKIESHDDDTYQNLGDLLALFNIKISDFILNDKSGASIDIKGILNKLDDFLKNNKTVLPPDINLSAVKTAENIVDKIMKELNDAEDFPYSSEGNHITDNESKEYTVDLSELKSLIDKIRNSLKNGARPAEPLKENISDTKLASIKDDGKINGDKDVNIDTPHYQSESQYQGNYHKQDQSGDTQLKGDTKSIEIKYTGIEAIKPNKETSEIKNTKDYSANVKMKSNIKTDAMDNNNIFVKIKTPSFNEANGEVERDFGKDILSQVSDGIKMNLSVGGGKSSAEIKLKPDHLGNISLALEIDKGIVTAKFTVQNEQVKSVIESNLNQLYDALKSQGYNVSDILVSLDMSFNNSGGGDNGGRQQNRNFIKINTKDAEKSFDFSMFKYESSSINYLV